MKRDTIGRIILDNYKTIDNYTIGRKEKTWIMIDNKKYLFKTGASNYEIYAELISSELARQCGFRTATYDLAILNGKTGVLTPSFLEFGDTIISGRKYLEYAKEVALENNMYMDFKENSIENILNAVAILDGKNSLIDSINIILNQLLEIWFFDITIMESDRNNTNWSLIKNLDGNIQMAPIYDCSTMARMNTNIDSLVKNLRFNDQLYNITDSIQYSLKIQNVDSNYYKDVEYLTMYFYEQTKAIIESLSKIDVNKAIFDIEKRINEHTSDDKKFEIPYSVKIWLEKSIGLRLDIIKNIFKNTERKMFDEKTK